MIDAKFSTHLEELLNSEEEIHGLWKMNEDASLDLGLLTSVPVGESDGRHCGWRVLGKPKGKHFILVFNRRR
jgi:hypothetical protein